MTDETTHAPYRPQLGEPVLYHVPGHTEDIVHVQDGRKTIEHVSHAGAEHAAIVTAVHGEGDVVDLIVFEPMARPSPVGKVHTVDGATPYEATVRAFGTPYVAPELDTE